MPYSNFDQVIRDYLADLITFNTVLKYANYFGKHVCLTDDHQGLIVSDSPITVHSKY